MSGARSSTAHDAAAETRALLTELLGRLFGEGLDREDLVAAESGEWLASLWSAVESAGLARVHLPEQAGGAGASWREAFVVAKGVGRYCVPLPIVESMLGAWLLMQAGLPVPQGPITLVPRPLDAGELDGPHVELTAPRVPWGRHARHLVAIAPAGDGARIACVPLEGAEIRCGESLALEPRDEVRISTTCTVAEVPCAADTLGTLGAMLRAAQMAGALETLLELSVRYAGERVQFGRPIGQFQAVQQELARLAGLVATACTAAELAFRAAADATSWSGELDLPGDPSFEIACAKVVAGEAAEQGPRIAHQVHGAIGFTYEHTLHFATRRLWSWRSEFGTAEQWAARLGERMLRAGGEHLWSRVTAG